jgi:hypothetical protein
MSEASVCILRASGYLVRSPAPETALQLWCLYNYSAANSRSRTRVRPACAYCVLLVNWCSHLHQKLRNNCGAFTVKPRGQLTLLCAHSWGQWLHTVRCWLPDALTCKSNAHFNYSACRALTCEVQNVDPTRPCKRTDPLKKCALEMGCL